MNVALVILIGLLSINYLVFHITAEFISMIIAAAAFTIIWINRDRIENGFFIVMTIGLVCAAAVDFFHTLTFKGMNILPGIDPNLSSVLWVAARSIQSLTLIAASVCISRKSNNWIPITVIPLFTAGVVLMVFNGIHPNFILKGENYSLFRKIVAYTNIAIFLLAGIRIALKKEIFDKVIFRNIIFYILFAILAELAFRFYIDVYNLSDILGPLFKLISYYFIFYTVVLTGLRHPHNLFFNQLSNNSYRLNRLFDNIQEGITINDQNGVFTFANPAAEKIFNLAPGELIGQSQFKFLSPDQQEILKNELIKRPHGEISTYEVQFTMQDGEKKDLIITGSPNIINGKYMGDFGIFRDISDRKRMESALRDTADRLTSILNSMSDGFFTLDKDLVITFFNPRAEHLLGKTKEEVVGKRLFDAFPEAEGSIFEEKYRQAIEEKRSLFFETDFQQKPYQNFFRINVYPYQDGIAVYFKVLTEEKRRELALRLQENRYRLLFENAGVGIGYWDTESRLVAFNQQAIKNMGFGTLSDFAGKTTVDLYGKKTGSLYQQRIERALTSTESFTYEDKFDGNLWFRSIYTRTTDQFGNVDGVQIMSIDITEGKRAEQERDSLAKFTDESPYPVLRISSEGVLLHANANSKEILEKWGCRMGETVPRKIRQSIERAYQTNKNISLEFDLEKRVFLMHVVPIQEMEYVNLYASDITSQRKAEEELQEYSQGLEIAVEKKSGELLEAQEKIVRQEKLSILGQLASGVGHELRNPLAVINNALYILRATLKESDAYPPVEKYLGMIGQEIATADKIIADLLNFARIKQVDRSLINLGDLLKDILSRRTPPENISIANHVQTSTPNPYVDATQIKQVFTNLITNAFQAMPEGGTLTLKAETSKNFLAIHVRDSGIGILEENMKMLFQPLFTTKSKGIGLGLTVTKMLVEANGGTIEVESKPGKGTLFTVFLPLNNYEESENH